LQALVLDLLYKVAAAQRRNGRHPQCNKKRNSGRDSMSVRCKAQDV